MNKNLTIIVAITSLAVGILIEKEFNFFDSPTKADETAKEEKEAVKPVWRKAFSVIDVKSPIDGNLQKAYFYKTKSAEKQPLIVSLHTWSHDYTQYDSINEYSLNKDYNYIHPNFRGINNNKNTCCSELVISDIDAAIDYALDNANVDTTQIFVMGMSGGGYATLAMFMKSKHRIKKFSSWVPLVDLVQWMEETKIRKLKYSDEILLCTNSKDSALNKQVAIQKSPIYWATPLEKLDYAKLAIYTGVYDGMLGNGVIPITHSINFYNKILKDLNEKDGSKYVSDSEKLFLLEFRKPLADFGSMAGREISLIKESKNIKLTLFEGGHEMLTKYAFQDLFK